MYVCRAKATSLTDAKLFLELDVPSNVFSGLARQQYEPPEFLTSYLNETVKGYHRVAKIVSIMYYITMFLPFS